jgi:hypothetical protein
MSRPLVPVALAALLLAGCSSTDTQPPSSGKGIAPGTSYGQAIASPPEVVSGTPTAGPTTRPIAVAYAAPPEFRPEQYAKAIDEYLQKKKAPTTAPATVEIVRPPDPPPQPKVVWIEPPGMQPADNAEAMRPAQVMQGAMAAPAPPARVDDAPTPTPDANAGPVVERRPAAAPPPRMQAVGERSDQLEAKLARQVRDYPRDMGAQLDYQLLAMVSGRQVPQLDVIAGLPGEDREVLAAVLDAMANFRTGARDDNQLISRKVRPLVDLSERLRTQASLRVPTIALCTRVDAFGVYEPIASSKFAAGKEHSMIVYCEVENFTSKLNEQKMWQTDLTQEAVLYNDKGQRVLAEEKKRTVSDLSRNRRRDFFVVRLLRLPANLPVGQYHLVLTICDQQAQRITESSLPIQIVAEQ